VVPPTPVVEPPPPAPIPPPVPPTPTPGPPVITESNTVPDYLGQCMLKTVSGNLISSANLTAETIYLVCNQPICTAPQLAILNVETGRITCK
jgi:hypothetical protein